MTHTILLFTGILFGLSLLLVLFIILHQKRRLKYEIDKTEQKIQFQEKLLTEIIKAQDLEKSRIGRELHDNINGLMMIAKLNIQKLNLIGSDDALDSIADAMRETRELSHGLAFSSLETYGLEYAIKQHIKRIDRNVSYSLKFDFKLKDEPELDISKQLYRIFQESILNINKYAEAKSVIVDFIEDNNKIHLLIKDNGNGFDTSTTKDGIGLHNIKLRAKTINASVDIVSNVGKGTSIIVKV